MHGEPNLDVEKIVAELEKERDRLNQAIAALTGHTRLTAARKTVATNGKFRGRQRHRGLTPAGRKRLSDMMKKRWAKKRRKAKSS